MPAHGPRGAWTRAAVARAGAAAACARGQRRPHAGLRGLAQGVRRPARRRRRRARPQYGARADPAADDALNARIVKLTRLLEKARDAEMALGSDVLVTALEGYAVLKAVGKAEGVHALKKLLSRRFDTGPRQEEQAPAPASA